MKSNFIVENFYTKFYEKLKFLNVINKQIRLFFAFFFNMRFRQQRITQNFKSTIVLNLNRLFNIYKILHYQKRNF